MKSFTKVLVAVALFVSFAGGALAQNTTSSHQEAGKEIVMSVNVPECNYQSGRVDLNDGTIICVYGLSGKIESENIAFAEKLAEEHLTAKRAAAAAYLQKDVIRMTAPIVFDDGIIRNLIVEVYPKKGKMQIFRSSSYCENGIQKATFLVTPEGDLLMSRPERMHGCGNLHVLLNPESRKIRVYVTDSLSFNDPSRRNVNNSWILDY